MDIGPCTRLCVVYAHSCNQHQKAGVRNGNEERQQVNMSPTYRILSLTKNCVRTYDVINFINQERSSELTIWANSNRNKELPEEWQIEGLADKFHDYPVIFNGTSSPVKQTPSGTNHIPAINIFQGGKNDNG